ncbi:MAG TPA: hypothetical protein VN914_17610, partial [Polyangia bacterium]|nr:hypothetical protein [Polyangia bacterium]
MVLAWGGCASAPAVPDGRARCGLGTRPFDQVRETVRREAEAWLAFVEFHPGASYDSGPSPPKRRLQPVDGGKHLALLSYPDAPAGDPTARRSYVYDDALALLWLTATGDEPRARALAHTLVALQ